MRGAFRSVGDCKHRHLGVVVPAGRAIRVSIVKAEGGAANASERIDCRHVVDPLVVVRSGSNPVFNPARKCATSACTGLGVRALHGRIA